MPGARITGGVRGSLDTMSLAQSASDREVDAWIIPRINKKLRRLSDLFCTENDLIFHVSRRTSKRDWSMSTTWLKCEPLVQP
jgi:hypothetical protein